MRSYLKPVLALPFAALPALAFAGATSCSKGATLKKNSRPNIIFIMMDDAGYGDFGCYGQQKIETPNIDAMADRGVRFSDMYTMAPLSSPSRCGLLTGQHAGHAQIRANDEMEYRGDVWDHAAMLADPYLEGQFPLAAGTPTLGSVLKSAGYSTAMVGKWGVGAPLSEGAPNNMGFDYFYGYNCQRLAHVYYPPFMWENRHRVYIEGNELLPPNTPLDEGADPYDIHSYDKYTQAHYSPDLMYERIEHYVDSVATTKTPFFLMWTTTVPHSSVQAPADEVQYYVNKLGDEEPVEGKNYYSSRYPHATYAAMITHIDRQIGNLVAHLKELGLYDNTVIIFTSDNGPANNTNSPMEYFESGGPFKCRKGWGKSSLHEGGIRMPFIVTYGDKLKGEGVQKTPFALPEGGRITSHMAQFTDVMPTLCELAGAKCPETDGISFLPILQGKESKQKEHKYLYWEFPGGKGWVGVRYGSWKGFIKGVKEGVGEFSLYDLSTDPRESKDIAAEHPEVVAKMWEYVKASHSPVPSGNPKFELDIDSVAPKE